jgi:hypothetical protein
MVHFKVYSRVARLNFFIPIPSILVCFGRPFERYNFEIFNDHLVYFGAFALIYGNFGRFCGIFCILPILVHIPIASRKIWQPLQFKAVFF